MKRRKSKSFNKSWEAYLFLTPWIIGMLAFTIVPILLSLYYSFTQYDLFTPPRWVGLQNYRDMLSDSRLHNSLRVTFTYVALTVPFQLSFALILASVLKKQRRGVRFYRAVFYLPSLLGGSVAIALLWRQIFNRQGIVNRVLYLLFGIEGINWIGTPQTALYTLVFLAVWQFGASMIIFLGGLKQISPDYYEAAEVDGASKVQSFFKITIPLLAPMVFFNVVMSVIGTFQAFTPAFIVSGGSGGPADATMFYTLYLYIRGFTQFAMGYASAMAWFLLVIIGIITRLLFMAANKWVYYEE